MIDPMIPLKTNDIGLAPMGIVATVTEIQLPCSIAVDQFGGQQLFLIC